MDIWVNIRKPMHTEDQIESLDISSNEVAGRYAGLSVRIGGTDPLLMSTIEFNGITIDSLPVRIGWRGW